MFLLCRLITTENIVIGVDKMKTVKYCCEKCNHVEGYTNKEKMIIITKKVLFGFILALGIVVLMLMLIIGPIRTLESLSTGMMIGFTTNKQSQEELRDITISIVGSCPYTDTFCYSWSVFNHLSHLKYTPASLLSPLQDPLYTYEKSGDCKNTSLLYTTMLRSVGVNAQIVCSITENHCVTKVPYNKEQYFIVDLTMNERGFFTMNYDENFWDYQYKESFLLES